MEARSREILYNKEAAPGYFRLGIRWPAPRVRAGHFVMLRVTGSFDPLLRRPLGVYKTIERGRKPVGIELLYRVVGRGTRLLSEKEAGETVDVLGPLGNGFPAHKKGEKAIMVAGGMGIVPLYLLAKKLKKGLLLYGARSASEAAFARDFRGLGCGIKVSTEDGSTGRKGLVTELLKEEMTPSSVIYACGPPGMLKAVSRMAADAGAKCHVSLERSMACGIGVCLGCAVRSLRHNEKENRNYLMVCSDGPVFDARDIDWGSL